MRALRWLIGVCVMVTVWGGVLAQDADTDPAPDWCVAVWYPSSEDPTGKETMLNHLDLIDVVHPFWYSPAPDGSLIAHGNRGAEDADLLAAWREAGVQIIPSIFASLPDPIIGAERRANHIAQIVERVEQFDYDGIDIDYEGFPAGTRDDFSLFIEELAQALHARGRLLVVTVHAKTQDITAYDGSTAQDWARIAPPADVFNLMTYDYTSRNRPPGEISPPAWVAEVLAYTETVTDLSKVRMGIPFYGYSWMRGTPPATTITWQGVQRWVESFEPEVIRDPDSAELSIDLRVTGLPRQTVSLVDADSLKTKLALILEVYPTLGGVAIWGIGGEDPANWDVLRETAGHCARPD